MDYFEAILQPEGVEKLEDLAPVIELYHHMVSAGKLDEAWILFRERLHSPMYHQFGAYQSMVELMSVMLTKQNSPIPNLTKYADQAWFLAALGNAYSVSGQPYLAEPLFILSNEVDKKR
jgi:hypothetical protein